MKIVIKERLILVILLILPILGITLLPTIGFTGDAIGLPWESALDKLVQSITGTIAFSVSIAGIAAGIIPFIFGDELGQFTRIALRMTLGISVLLFSTSFLSVMFGVSGAIIL